MGSNKIKDYTKPTDDKGKQEVPKGGSPPRQETGTRVWSDAVPARVEEVVGVTGMRGEAIQVRCKVLAGRDANKTLRRNCKGPVKLGDILMLRETEIEARPLTKGSGRK